MKLKLLLALVAVLALITLGTAGYLWHLFWGPGSDENLRTPTAVEGPIAAVGSAVEKGPGKSPIGTRRRPERAAEPPAADWWRISGKISRADACGEDPGLVVYSLRRQADFDELLAELSRKIGAADPTTEALILDRHPVSPDGTFTAAFPPRLENGHVLALGDYLFTASSQRVAPAGEGASLRPRCGARVSGTIRAIPVGGGPAEPAVGVEVSLSSLPRGLLGARDPVARTAFTDPGGHFSFPALPLPDGYEIRAFSEELATTFVDLTDLEAGRTRRIELSLSRGAGVAGRVIDWTGAPIAGARVSGVVPGTVNRNSYGQREAETAADGSFLLEALPATTVTLSADREGLLESRPLRLELIEGEVLAEVELTLEAGASISGTLAWPDGEPVVDQEVLVEFDKAGRFGVMGSDLGSARGARETARTDATGSFVVRGLGRGPFAVLARVRADRRSGSSTPEPRDVDWTARAEGVAPDTAGLDLILTATQAVSGRVLTFEGKAVAEFEIHATHLMQTRIGPMARRQFDRRFVDPEGGFRLEGMEAGQWQVYALAEGYATSEPVTVSIAEEAPEPLTFQLIPAARVRGVVLTSEGAPISGALVYSDEGGPQWMSGAAGEPRRIAAATLEDGSFEIDGLPPGTVSLFARAAGHSRSAAAVLELGVGETTDEVQLVLGSGGTLTVEVFGGDGRPIPHALVQLIASPSFDIQFGTCDPAGRLRFESLNPGTWQVVGLPSEERLQDLAGSDTEARGTLIQEIRTDVVEVVEGALVHVVLGVPPKDPVRVTGSVILGTDPVPGVILAFYREGKEVARHKRRASTDATGEFSVTLDGHGWYAVEVIRVAGAAGREASLEYSIEIPDTQEYRLAIELPGGRISGRVIGPGGDPVREAQVSLRPHGAVATRWFREGRFSQAITDANGNFELDGLIAGDYVIAAGGMNTGGLFETPTLFGRVLKPLRLDEGESLDEVVLELEKPGSVRLRVLDPGGKPKGGAAIFVRNEDGELLELNSLATTDSAGLCSYDGLAPGSYTFSARRSDLASPESSPVRVDSGASAELTLRLEESTFLCIESFDGRGVGVETEIRILDSAGRELQSMSTLEEYLEIAREFGYSTTRRRFGPLPPGKYRVRARRGEHLVEKRITLAGRRERKLSLRFDH